MTSTSAQCENLQAQVESLLQLLHQESSLRASQDITSVQASLQKAISPTFEIVFAGAFSAGKSMLINALLERELLYSAEGHATGTECYIAYADTDQERVVLTFLSETEIREQAVALCQKLGLSAAAKAAAHIHQPDEINTLRQGCQEIIQQEGGESKSERAKQAKALDLLMAGFLANRDRIQLRQRLDDLIRSQFWDTPKVHKTSGLLGFYGSQIKQTTERDRFGLDSILAEAVRGTGIQEETPQFVNEFNRYCGSGKFVGSEFKPSVRGYETPAENYVRILSEWGLPLLEKLIQDSGIEEFRTSITRYLTEEKRPQLFANLADDLQPLCINLKKHYLAIQRDLDSQPHEIEAMKAQELERLNQELQQVGREFCIHIAEEVNQAVTNSCNAFEIEFRQLQHQMIQRLDELLNTFSVAQAYSRATRSHPRNATAPLIAVLVEALYDLANQLEDVLVKASQQVASHFFVYLMEQIRRRDYYRQLYRLLGNDGGIEQQLKGVEKLVCQALASEARTECDRYVRESPRFYDEGTFSIYQFRQTLEQTSQGYDAESMIAAEPAIRQLLKLDFEPKVEATIRRNFRQTMNQTLKTLLLHKAVNVL
ncbi:MAG: dynamin family protein [Coleofasciculus sp. B1-GNL1-01]|uniref:dynamin family protein n=1 Tax=Coleofasciculus sp. B1-GNL1-01 TaxID=3068484 RepID=UPI0032FCC96B